MSGDIGYGKGASYKKVQWNGVLGNKTNTLRREQT